MEERLRTLRRGQWGRQWRLRLYRRRRWQRNKGVCSHSCTPQLGAGINAQLIWITRSWGLS